MNPHTKMQINTVAHKDTAAFMHIRVRSLTVRGRGQVCSISSMCPAEGSWDKAVDPPVTQHQHGADTPLAETETYNPANLFPHCAFPPLASALPHPESPTPPGHLLSSAGKMTV